MKRAYSQDAFFCHFRENRRKGKGLLSSLILRDNEGRPEGGEAYLHVLSLRSFRCSSAIETASTPVSHVDVRRPHHQQHAGCDFASRVWCMRDQSSGLKLLLFVLCQVIRCDQAPEIECFSFDFEPCAIAGQFVAELIGARGGAGEGDRTD